MGRTLRCMSAAVVAVVAVAGAGVSSAAADAPGSAAPRSVVRVIHRPTTGYTTRSCLVDLAGYQDRQVYTMLTGCGRTIWLSTGFMKLTVPDEWSNWSCPPASETCTPDILYSDTAPAATVDFGGRTVTRGGLEYEPNRFQVETVTVSFFSGRYGSGTLVKSITRQVDGDGGARLFALRARPGYRSVVISNNADDDFAIAQIRV